MGDRAHLFPWVATWPHVLLDLGRCSISLWEARESEGSGEAWGLLCWGRFKGGPALCGCSLGAVSLLEHNGEEHELLGQGELGSNPASASAWEAGS